jgi:uncharacterized membrane protein YqhA
MKHVMRRAVAGSRFIILAAALGAFFASMLALFYGLVVIGVAIRDVIRDETFNMLTARVLASNLINIVDLLLLGTVLYIAAIGLYKLFIDEEVVTPSWMTLNDLDDIKTRIVTVVVVLLSVEFLAAVVEFTGENILEFGAAIGIVLLALAAFLYVILREGHPETGRKIEARKE